MKKQNRKKYDKQNDIKIIIKKKIIKSIHQIDSKIITPIYQNDIEQKYKEYLSNKTICIVGPSASLIGSKKGTIIDNYDVVIRIKKGFPIDKNIVGDVGSKTDIIYSNLKYAQQKDSEGNFYYQNNFGKKDFIKMYKRNVKYIVCPYPINQTPFNNFLLQFVTNYDDKIPVKLSLDNKIFQKTVLELNGHHPTIFLGTILDLLNYQWKQLYITGFTFREDGYQSNYKTNSQANASANRTLVKKKIHDLSLEKQLFKKIYIENKDKIILDEYLHKIIAI